MKLNSIKTIYFIGIGGIGMSALARYFKGRGVAVHGYDRTETALTKTLATEGMIIHYEDDVTYIPEGVDLVVYTPAVPRSHGELSYFFDNDFPVKKRAEVLGIISRSMKAIGIAGTHGKTTTSSITTHILTEGGIDCSAFLGGIAQNFESNFVEGQSDWVVVEADEFDRSFLQLNPTIAAVMSMDADHLDIYGDHATMHDGFHQYVERTQAGGTIFKKADLPLSPKVADNVNIQTFGIEQGDFQSKNIRVEDGYFVFDYQSPIENMEGLQFTLPGHHNVENATVAIAIAQTLGVTADNIRKALLNFKGIQRRFEFRVRTNERVFIDDYAHHPSELKAAIHAARTLYPNKKITGIFQPHLYSRTKDFVDGFAEAIDKLDEIILLDIYPARELPMKGVTSTIIFNKMVNPNKKMILKQDLLEKLKLNDTEVLLTLGAGDIDKLVEPIEDMLLKLC